MAGQDEQAEDKAGSPEVASPPCSMHEVDPAYMGLATVQSRHTPDEPLAVPAVSKAGDKLVRNSFCGGVLIPMDYKKLKKPTQMSDDVWRQHLSWMEVVGKQLDENIAKRRKQIETQRTEANAQTSGVERENRSSGD